VPLGALEGCHHPPEGPAIAAVPYGRRTLRAERSTPVGGNISYKHQRLYPFRPFYLQLAIHVSQVLYFDMYTFGPPLSAQDLCPLACTDRLIITEHGQTCTCGWYSSPSSSARQQEARSLTAAGCEADEARTTGPGSLWNMTATSPHDWLLPSVSTASRAYRARSSTWVEVEPCHDGGGGGGGDGTAVSGGTRRGWEEGRRDGNGVSGRHMIYLGYRF